MIEPIIGRYLHLAIGGEAHRLYFEEAGTGIPLVCVHTAGADARQWRHLLNDGAVTRRFRVIAPDLPWHGKSTPPPGWQDRDYALSSDRFMETILALADALDLDRPVFMGCSIGGRIALHLALEHPHRFRALVGLEAAARQKPWYDTDWLDRPDVHGGEVCAALISGLVAPQSPDEYRHETLWQYKTSGPGVFKGDLHFYRKEPDLSARMGNIDTSACPLYLLTGSHDFSCTPEDSMETAAAVPGARFRKMRGLGHFPMSENPGRFREEILPVLQEIADRG